MQILGFEVKRVRPKVEPVNPASFLQLEYPLTPRRAVRSQGLYEQFVFPLIDRNNPWEVMALRKYQEDLQSRLSGARASYSVCGLTELLHALQIPATPASARALQLLHKCHCVDFALMPQEIFESLPHLANYVVSGGEVKHSSMAFLEEPWTLTA